MIIDFKGQVSLVTGAAGTIGKSIARELANSGQKCL